MQGTRFVPSTDPVVLVAGAYAAQSLVVNDTFVVVFSWVADLPGHTKTYNGALTLPRLATHALAFPWLPALAALRVAPLPCSHHECDVRRAPRLELRIALARHTTKLALRLFAADEDRSVAAVVDSTHFTVLGCRLARPLLSLALILDGSLLEWDIDDGRASCAHRWYRRAAPLAHLNLSSSSDLRLLQAWQLRDTAFDEHDELSS